MLFFFCRIFFRKWAIKSLWPSELSRLFFLGWGKTLTLFDMPFFCNPNVYRNPTCQNKKIVVASPTCEPACRFSPLAEFPPPPV